MAKQIDIDKLIDDYNEMKRMFKEIDNNAKSITKFIDKFIDESIDS